MENRDTNYYYDIGFRDGYIKGQERGLKIATQALSLNKEPLIISCDSEETAKSIMEQFKK